MYLALEILTVMLGAVTMSLALAHALETLSGIRVLPDQIAASWPSKHRMPVPRDREPAKALDAALQMIAARYGIRSAEFVAAQLEYPQQALRGVASRQ
jgi:hypothetical protein